MVELIGIVTIVAMNWVVAASMANESESDHQHHPHRGVEGDEGRWMTLADGLPTRHAA